MRPNSTSFGKFLPAPSQMKSILRKKRTFYQKSSWHLSGRTLFSRFLIRLDRLSWPSSVSIKQVLRNNVSKKSKNNVLFTQSPVGSGPGRTLFSRFLSRLHRLIWPSNFSIKHVFRRKCLWKCEISVLFTQSLPGSAPGRALLSRFLNGLRRLICSSNVSFKHMLRKKVFGNAKKAYFLPKVPSTASLAESYFLGF